jgi:hypothetical protein
MCDPLTLTIGLVGGGAMVSEQRNSRKAANAAAAAQAAAQPDPAAERAKAEAEAAQRVNAQLADANRRRREQGSLLAKGAPAAPTFSLGDADGEAQSPIGAPGSFGLRKPTSRSTVAQQASLMSRGAPGGYGGGGGGRSGGGDIRMNLA